MVTDESGQTFYVFCKVLFEEITEEFLLKNYCIKKTSNRKVGRGSMLQSILLGNKDLSSKRNSKLERVPGRRDSTMTLSANKNKRKISWGEKEDLKSALGVSKQGTRPVGSRKNSIALSYDELDIIGTRHSKLNMKARKLCNTPQESKVPEAKVNNKTYYVPLAVCIKTKHSSHTSAEQLLLALIQTLYTEPNFYTLDLHNLIYSYSDFLSQIMMLTHITSPPPLTQYKVAVGAADVRYIEGTFAEFPSEDDASVAKLFGMLSVDCILRMWVTLLLDIRTVLYVSDINEYFYIIKALNQLMFPLKWHFSKGILPDLFLLSQPVPYVYGIVDSLYQNKEDIIDYLFEEDISFLLLDVNNSQITPSANHFLHTFPEESSLVAELNHILTKYNAEEILNLAEEKQVEFSKEVREVFLKHLLPYIKDVEKVFKRTKTENFFAFSRAYTAHYKSHYAGEAQWEFVEKLASAQSFAALFDDMCLQLQSDYLRLKPMKDLKNVYLGEHMKVDIISPRPVVLSRIARLADIARKEKSRESGSSSDKLLQTVKVGWIDEVFKMQELAAKKLKKSSIVLKKRSEVLHSVSSDASSGNICSPVRNEEGKKVLFELELSVIEEKAQCLPEKGLSLAAPNSQLILGQESKLKQVMRRSKLRKGIFFYGPKGILSFCQELFCLSNNQKNILPLFDDIKLVLEKCRNGSTKIKASSVNEPVKKKVSFKTKDDNDLADAGIPQVAIGSPLLGALVDSRSLELLSAGGRCDEASVRFSAPSSCQFFVFCALYYSQHLHSPYQVVQVSRAVSVVLSGGV